MSNLSHCQQLIFDIIRKHPTFSNIQANEAIAAASHFLQNPYGDIPLINKKLQSELLSAIDATYNREQGIMGAEDTDELPNIELPSLFDDVPYPPPAEYNFTFIDLFAGIGGFRQAFQNAGGKCVFSSEWNKYAQKTYAANYGEIPYGDIRAIPKEQIPRHDVLCAGFPCQPFSLAGVSKKNSLGRKHGFEDETQGTLFFEIKEILRLKRPKAFMLENVKNLLAHDKGKTFEVIRRSLVDELGYVISYKIVNGAAWVPQHRERIYILGFDPKQVNIKCDEINVPDKPESGYIYPKLSGIIKRRLDGYTLGPGTWATLERHKAHHEKAGNGFGYGLLTWPMKANAVTRTISARYHKDGAEILVEQEGDRPRKLSVEEAMQLQGYNPGRFVFPVSATQAYTQIGNSVVVPAIEASAKVIAKILKEKSI
ncbi:MAG: DNA (cytosine-5-)-methyltransferase [Akkermansia sp.]|nr:DNA (cytosine-5-)-methyltransferase [Akkermansia sp.]